MTPATTPPVRPLSLDAGRYAAARRLCRTRSPDLFFAAHFTSRPRRYALYALDSLFHQLDEIMGPPQIGAAPAPAIVSAQAGCCGGGCGGEGESIERRRDVCLAVIDHLYSGLDTGKPELDAFLDVNAAAALPKAWLATMVQGMATQRTLPRYATWKRISEVMGQSHGMRAMLMARVLADPGRELSATEEGQLLAWGAAIRLCEAIEQTGDDYRHGRILLPLDDLVRHNLSERDIAAFTEQGGIGGDARWTRLMQFQLERIRNLLRGGARAMSVLADDGARRAFAATGTFALRRLERLIKAGGDPFATRITTSTWQRLAAMPRAVRAVWDAAQKRA